MRKDAINRPDGSLHAIQAAKAAFIPSALAYLQAFARGVHLVAHRAQLLERALQTQPGEHALLFGARRGAGLALAIALVGLGGLCAGAGRLLSAPFACFRGLRFRDTRRL